MRTGLPSLGASLPFLFPCPIKKQKIHLEATAQFFLQLTELRDINMAMASNGLLHAIVILLALLSFSATVSGCIIFNFGDSNSDTGNICFFSGMCSATDRSSLTGRASDDRIIIDFFGQSLNQSFLNPYMRAIDGDFHKGANFAFGGGTVLNENNCFNLGSEINVFLNFKSIILSQNGEKRIIEEVGFRKAVYMLDIGQNDLALTLLNNTTTVEGFLTTIPDIMKEIKEGIQILYENGARKFWIHNTGPLGCIPNYKFMFPNLVVDPQGCLYVAMNASKEFNNQLWNLLGELRSKLQGSTIVYVDVFSVKYDLFVNYDKYGFQSKFGFCENYTTVCPIGSKYIFWDLIHYSDLSNSIVSSKILSGAYSDPFINFADLCNI